MTAIRPEEDPMDVAGVVLPDVEREECSRCGNPAHVVVTTKFFGREPLCLPCEINVRLDGQVIELG